MKLLVMLSRFPYPLEKGDKLRAYHQLVDLSKAHEVHLCCLTDKNPTASDLAEVKKICSKVYVFKLSKIKQIFRLVYAAFSSKPFQVHYFYQKSIAKRVKEIIQEVKPDHIYTQLVRCTEYVKNFHEMPKTLDFMDAFNKNYSRRIPGSKGIVKLLVKEEAKRLVAYEHLVFDYFEKHAIISEQDKELIYHKSRDKICIVPNGVDYNYFSPVNVANETQCIDLVFTGNMGYLPNEDAALFLIKTIMPLIWKKDPNVTLSIAGAKPSLELTNLASEKVKITGWVDDIRTEFRKAKIFIAPMRQGTGLQNKLLEAMSLELPCVTTPLANNALHATPGKHLFVYENNSELVDMVLDLLQNQTKRKTIGKAAREFILENYSWQSANKKLQELITR